MAGHYPGRETLSEAHLLAISPSSQPHVNFALALVFLVIAIDQLLPGLFFLHITTRYFAEVGQDLQLVGQPEIQATHREDPTFFELTTASSDPIFAKLDGLSLLIEFNDIALIWCCSRTVGSCEEAEITEGRERRPPDAVELPVSPVTLVEVLAEDECLRSVLALGDSLRMLSSFGGSQRDSSLIGEVMTVEDCGE